MLLGATGAATGTVLTAGCTDDGAAKTEAAARQRTTGERTRARAARDSGALVARYDAVLAAHPALGVRLAPLRAEVARHTQAFGGAPGGASAAAPGRPAGRTPVAGSGTESPSGPAAGPPGAAPPVPASETDALKMLASAERTLAGRRAQDLLRVPGELARLLASVAAAGAAHAYLLTEGAGEG